MSCGKWKKGRKTKIQCEHLEEEIFVSLKDKTKIASNCKDCRRWIIVHPLNTEENSK